ncbi:MAG: sialidase family protein [Marmoricola sp.]
MKDPRSSGALNLLAARNPGVSSPKMFKTDARLQISQTSVNNPGADATAQDTQSETSVAAIGSGVTVAYNDSASFNANNQFTGYARSGNNGLSFADRGALPASPEGDGGDPVLAADQSAGVVYMATLGFTTGHNIQVFKSTDGGVTFAAPVNGTPGFGVTGEFQDKNWTTVDNFAGTGQHNVYLCWTRFGAGGQEEVRLTRSTDSGATFGPTLGTLVSTGGQGCFVTVSTDHSVSMFYYRGTGGRGTGR